jgi:hypothetical protein
MDKVANITTLTELMGINTAAIRGEREPDTANDNPTTLYMKEIIKLIITTLKASFVNLINLSSEPNLDDSMMPSQAGEKL